jgi:hypothetical protein
MSVFHPRNRLVNFRLSEEEFSKLRDNCAAHECRSISDFARQAVLDKLEQGPGAKPDKLRNLDGKVTQLEQRVSELLGILESTGQSVAPSDLQASAHAERR